MPQFISKRSYTTLIVYCIAIFLTVIMKNRGRNNTMHCVDKDDQTFIDALYIFCGRLLIVTKLLTIPKNFGQKNMWSG